MNEILEKKNEIEHRLGYRFRSPDLLALAFVHRSYWNEHQDEVPDHNERLEFLGDSVLGLVVAEHLYLHLPDTPEGTLSDLRSRLVEAVSCVLFLQKLGIADFLLLGRGERMNVGKGRESILADLFEALMGAIYLDGGYEAAKHFFFRHFEAEVAKIVDRPARNWKAELQDYSQKKFQQAPVYEVIEESGPSHQKTFRIAVFINFHKVGEGVGGSKKEAQQSAAADAMSQIEQGESL